MGLEVRKDEPPPPMSDEMQLAIELIAGVDAIIEDVARRRRAAEGDSPREPTGSEPTETQPDGE
jgi:hypothetical protein